LPHVLGAVSARRDHDELGGAVDGKSRIARRHALDDADFGIALVHQFACLFADRDGDSWVLVRDAGLIERRQKARVGPRIARIGLCRRGHPEHGGEARKHDKESHGFILVKIGALVSSNFNADESLLIRRRLRVMQMGQTGDDGRIGCPESDTLAALW
jgi:hypothetical protein